MQVILLEDVKSLGKKGTVVKVNDSYGRNYLIPRKLGVEANAANLNDLKLQNANMAKLEAAKLQSAKEVKEKLDGKSFVVRIKAGKDGRTFGSVTAKEVAQAIMDTAKIEIDKKKIVMEPIKALGEQHVKLKLHKDINAEILLKVEEA
ncbi:MAG TPA: 50S ribosomal protein L9 [Candidatus Avilachnospira avistercoris]|nr:50S ribosomal protein L9 [Candidatus Avilachnospira avistercoris]